MPGLFFNEFLKIILVPWGVPLHKNYIFYDKMLNEFLKIILMTAHPTSACPGMPGLFSNEFLKIILVPWGVPLHKNFMTKCLMNS
jgi:hypothetical protein